MLSRSDRFTLTNLCFSLLIAFFFSYLYYISNINTLDTYASFINGDTINQFYSKTTDYRVIPLFLSLLMISFIACEKSAVLEKMYSLYRLKSLTIPHSTAIIIKKSVEFLIIILIAYVTTKLIFILVGVEHYSMFRRNLLIIVFTTLSLFFKSRSLLVSQSLFSLSPLLYLKEEYVYNGELIHFENSNYLTLFLSILAILTLSLTIIDIVKKQHRVAFSSLIFLAILVIGSASRVYALDEYHVGELFTAFHQSFELRQALYSEFIPTKGFMHIAVGFINDQLYSGNYVTINLSSKLFSLLSAFLLLGIIVRYYSRWVICLLLIIGIPLYGHFRIDIYYPIVIGLCLLSDKKINENNYNFIIIFLVYFFISFLYYNAFALALFVSLIPILLYKIYKVFKLKQKPNKAQLIFIFIGLSVFIYAFDYIIGSLNYSLVNSSSNLFYWGNPGSSIKFIQSNFWIFIPITISYLFYTKQIEKNLNNLLWATFFVVFPFTILSYMEGRADGGFFRALGYSTFSSILLLSYVACNNIILRKKVKVVLCILPILILITIGFHPKLVTFKSLDAFKTHHISGDMLLSDEGVIPNLGKGFINTNRYNDLLTEYKLMNQLSKNETFLIIDPYTTQSARYSIYGKKVPTMSHAVLNVSSLDSQSTELKKVKKMSVKIIRISSGINRYHLFYKYLTSLDYVFTTFNNRDYLIAPELFNEIKVSFDLQEKNFFKSQYTTVEFGLLPLKWGGAFKYEKDNLAKTPVMLNAKSVNDITESPRYKLGKKDPYITFDVSQLMRGRENDLLYLEIEKSSESICSAQFFWSAGSVYNEENSIRFKLGNGKAIIPLGMNLNWLKSESVSSVRLDIDQCSGQGVTIKMINFYNYDYGD
ncbi:hypothetical protein [Moritella dasanensis]|uniref:hypothetical protein n=1 Tax=Moritella dasanensis TaxID=428031 RepID=UPI00031D1080|nr:hypothetical protein [Moritella dasanensis]